MTTTLQPRKAKPREPTGTQRLRLLAKRLAIEPRELAGSMKRAQCVSCTAELTYVRRYFEEHHCCESCEKGLDAETIAGLRELERYL